MHTRICQVLEYCEHHRGEPVPTAEETSNQDETRRRTTDIGEWDQKFITVDQEMLFEIILAANYLDIKALLYDGSLLQWTQNGSNEIPMSVMSAARPLRT